MSLTAKWVKLQVQKWWDNEIQFIMTPTQLSICCHWKVTFLNFKLLGFRGIKKPFFVKV